MIDTKPLPVEEVLYIIYICSDRILTCRINSICSPAKVGLVVTDFNYQPGS